MHTASDDTVTIDETKVITETHHKTSVRVALLERTMEHISNLLEKIDRKIDTVDRKVEKVEIKIYGNLKWLIGISIPTLIGILTLWFEIKQYWGIK